MMKVVCKKFSPLQRNTMLGFAEITIVDLGMTLRDIVVHSKNGASWASPPARPQVRDGTLMKDDSGKIVYAPIIEFGSREARDQFSNSVIEAVRATDEGRRALGQDKPQYKPVLDDQINF
jgi:hypothetical protein